MKKSKKIIRFCCPSGEELYCSLEDFLKICRNAEDGLEADEYDFIHSMSGLCGDFSIAGEEA